MNAALKETTALGTALESVGILPADRRLMQDAVDAWAAFPGENRAAERRECLTNRLRGEKTFALLELCEPQALPRLIGRLLLLARGEIREAAKTADGDRIRRDTQLARVPADDAGQGSSDAHTNCAGIVTLPRDAGSPRGSHAASSVATPNAGSPRGSNLSVLADKQAAAGRQRLATEIRLSRLDTVLVDGKPIGDCLVSEVRAWAQRRKDDARTAGRDASFALNLVANLPGDAIIRQWWKRTEEVDQLYTRAEAEHAA